MIELDIESAPNQGAAGNNRAQLKVAANYVLFIIVH
jgi:hypothetical protein